jgi:hypothetical protein
MKHRRQMKIEVVASHFVTHAIQEWGQPDILRIAAVQDVLNLSRFDATATCWPSLWRDLWPKACMGKDADEASTWLRTLTETMPRGQFEIESDHVKNAIESRRLNSTLPD